MVLSADQGQHPWGQPAPEDNLLRTLIHSQPGNAPTLYRSTQYQDITLHWKFRDQRTRLLLCVQIEDLHKMTWLSFCCCLVVNTSQLGKAKDVFLDVYVYIHIYVYTLQEKTVILLHSRMAMWWAQMSFHLRKLLISWWNKRCLESNDIVLRVHQRRLCRRHREPVRVVADRKNLRNVGQFAHHTSYFNQTLRACFKREWE